MSTVQGSSSHDNNGNLGDEQPWVAPQAAAAIRATVPLPGSKSATNRALLLAAISDGDSTLQAPLASRDTRLMVQALRALGTRIHGVDESDVAANDAVEGTTLTDSPTWRVQPGPWHRDTSVDCGLAGNVMRFVPAAAVLAKATISFDGDARARARPMAPLLEALQQLGADMVGAETGYLPFTIRGRGGLSGGAVHIDASASSQFISALLLVGARFDAGLTVKHVGDDVPSAPHIAMTIDMLADVGVAVTHDQPTRWRIDPGLVRGHQWEIEPDLSNAAPFLAAALVTGGEVTVPGWPTQTTQAGDALRELLTAFGGQVIQTLSGLTVRGGARISAVDLNLHDVGELTPVIAVLCALADGPCRLRGIAHLRGHETDRLAALAAELSALGAHASETEDGLAITPAPLHGGVFATYHDHRMAHAGALLGLVVRNLSVENIATTGKTLPDFPRMWHQMLRGDDMVLAAART